MVVAQLQTVFSVMAKTGQATKALDDLKKEHKKTMKSMSIASRSAEVVLTAFAGALVAVGAGAMVAMGAAMEFNTQMTTMRALSGSTKQAMYEMADSVHNVSTEFGMAGSEIAAGTVTLSKAGLTVEEINDSIRSMTMLARANGMAFDEAATMSVYAVETFGKKFSDIGTILDKMQVAAKESILDVSDLQKGFAYAGSTANMLGVSFEELISVMGVLSNRALHAGISARSFNKMLLDMFQHVGEVDALIKELGHSFSILGEDGKLNLTEMIDALGDTQLTTELLAAGLDIFTVRALRSFGVLAGAADDYAVMLAKVNDAAGTLEEVAGVQMEAWTYQFARLREEFMAIMQSPEMMEALGVMVTDLIALMNEIKPHILEYLVTSVREFSQIIADPGFRGVLLFFVDILGNLASVAGVLARHLSLGNGILLKGAVAIKIAVIAYNKLGLALLYNTDAGAKMLTNMKQIGLEHIKGTDNAKKQKAAMLSLQGGLQSLAMGYLAAYSAGMMFSSTGNTVMKVMIGITATVMAFNAALMVSQSLTAMATTMKSIPGWAGLAAGIVVFGSMMAMFAGAALSVRSSANQSTAELDAMTQKYQSAPIKDLGYSGIMEGSTYDTGGKIGPAPRHKMVWVEPGEQIISKTQGMVGQGGGVNVYVGDVYAQDGTDFANKLATALPKALRQVSYGGGF